eukprot:3561399-Amphidinium_carterae.2
MPWQDSPHPMVMCNAEAHQPHRRQPCARCGDPPGPPPAPSARVSAWKHGADAPGHSSFCLLHGDHLEDGICGSCEQPNGHAGVEASWGNTSHCSSPKRCGLNIGA